MKKVLIPLILATSLYASEGLAVEPQELLFAIANGHTDTIKEYIKEAKDVNAEISGTTPIIAAVTMGNINAIQELLNAGADVNKPMVFNQIKSYPLFTAITMGNSDIVKLLLEHGARTDLKEQNYTPAAFAKLLGKKEIAKIIYEHDVKRIKEKSSLDIKHFEGQSTKPKTYLSTLSSFDIAAAEQDKKKGKSAFVFLDDLSVSFGEGLASAFVLGYSRDPIYVFVATPYTMLRNLYYQRDVVYDEISEYEFQDVINNKDKVILSVGNFPGDLLPIQVKNIVVRKNEKIIRPTHDVPEYMQMYGSQYYVFPIEIFDGEPFDIIIIDANENKPREIHISKSLLEKRKLK